MDIPKSPLQAKFSNSTESLEQAEDKIKKLLDGEEDVITVEGEVMPADFDERIPGHREEKLNDITLKKQAKRATDIRNFSYDSGGIADLFQEGQSLQDQFGFDDSVANMHEDCQVCAKPRKSLEDLERALFFEQRSKIEVAKQYDLSVEDIDQHIEFCVLDRNVTVPSGSLVNTLVKEVHEFVARMSSFRLELDSSMDTDHIRMYLQVIGELRTTIKDVNNMQSPNDDAVLIVKRVFNPLIFQMVRFLALEVDTFRTQTSSFIIPSKNAEFKEALKDMIRRVSKSYKKAQNSAIVKFAEIQGVDLEVLLGDNVPNSEDM